MQKSPMKTNSQLKKTGQIKLEDRRTFKYTKPKKAKENLNKFHTELVQLSLKYVLKPKLNQIQQNKINGS